MHLGCANSLVVHLINTVLRERSSAAKGVRFTNLGEVVWNAGAAVSLVIALLMTLGD